MLGRIVLTWFLCGDVKSGAAGSESSAVLGSDWKRVDGAAFQAGQPSRGVGNPDSVCLTLLGSFFPNENLSKRHTSLPQTSGFINCLCSHSKAVCRFGKQSSQASHILPMSSWEPHNELMKKSILCTHIPEGTCCECVSIYFNVAGWHTVQDEALRVSAQHLLR